MTGGDAQGSGPAGVGEDESFSGKKLISLGMRV